MKDELPLDQLREKWVAHKGERFDERSLDYKDMLRKIKEHLKKNVDPELLKREIEKIFDQGTEILRMLLRTLKEKGKRKLEILVDALLNDDDRESRSMKDYWQKVKDYFRDLKIDLQEKYMRFGEWVKNAYDRGLERSKDKMENIKAIAKEFAKHAKNVSKEVGAEASDFFRQYKEDLGNVWEELKEAFKQIRNRED